MPPSSYPSFPSFPNLPPEIRNQIWTQACRNEASSNFVLYDRQPGGCGRAGKGLVSVFLGRACSSHSPGQGQREGQAGVNHESREAALRFYDVEVSVWIVDLKEDEAKKRKETSSDGNGIGTSRVFLGEGMRREEDSDGNGDRDWEARLLSGRLRLNLEYTVAAVAASGLSAKEEGVSYLGRGEMVGLVKARRQGPRQSSSPKSSALSQQDARGFEERTVVAAPRGVKFFDLDLANGKGQQLLGRCARNVLVVHRGYYDLDDSHCDWCVEEGFTDMGYNDFVRGGMAAAMMRPGERMLTEPEWKVRRYDLPGLGYLPPDGKVPEGVQIMHLDLRSWDYVDFSLFLEESESETEGGSVAWLEERMGKYLVKWKAGKGYVSVLGGPRIDKDKDETDPGEYVDDYDDDDDYPEGF